MRYSRVLLRVALAAFALFSGYLPTSGSNQILEIYDDSLTTYLPSGNTNVQDVRPLVTQRGVNIDGSLRSAPGFALQIAGNPFGEVWTGKEKLNDIRIDIGAYAPFDVDISLPSDGMRWIVGRTYNPRQENSSSTHIDSNGYQGKNWFQTSQPEIVLYEHATDDAKDVLYFVYGADRFVEFKRVDATSDHFKGKNGAAGVVVFADGGAGPDTYTYWDQNGNQAVFFGFDADASPAEGQFWKMIDPADNTSYVGHETTASTAISNGYDSGGRIVEVIDSADRRYTYTYTTLDSVTRLTKVVAETKTGGEWDTTPTGVEEVAKVEYEYYSNESYGDAGDLKLVIQTTPLDDPGVNLVRKKYYRYWEGAYNATTNPGHPHAIKLVVDFEGARNFDYSETGGTEPELDEGYLTASHASLEPYAAMYAEYDSSHRIDETFFNGECGCSGAGAGSHEFEYETSGYSNDAGYDTEWATRTITKRPDNSYIVQAFDEVSQGLDSIVTDADPDSASNMWPTHVERNADGQVIDVYTPASITTYTHLGGTVTKESGNGLVQHFERISSGDMKGFLSEVKHQTGTSGTQYYDEIRAYTSFTKSLTGVSVIRPLVDTSKRFADETTNSSLGDTTDFDYVAYTSNPLAIETVAQKHPSVSTSKNGSGSETIHNRHFKTDGRVDFEKSEDNRITYREYTDGLLTKTIRDANTATTADIPSAPTGFTSIGSDFCHLKTTYAHTAQGTQSSLVPPGGKAKASSYRTVLADGRPVTLKFTHASGNDLYGPVEYTVTNHQGKVDVRAVVALTGNKTSLAQAALFDETDADPITAADLGTLSEMTTYVYGDSGSTLLEERRYYDIPASGEGSLSNYDVTLYGYDDSGRRTRVKSAPGTINRTAYDLHGRVTDKWIGTNDSTFSGGESSGTDNMVKTENLVYDTGAAGGNGLLTKRTLYVEDGTTGQRVTEYEYDVRGNLLLEEKPTSPHAFHKYDNQGRRIATGLFSSVASIDLVNGDDPTTETANRLALTQTFYDEKGQVWKTQRHKIDDADGSDDDNLQTLTWYDAEGQVIKVDGPQLTKTTYDGDGRRTHQFILASDNDTAYSHAGDVLGDIVLEEHQTTYDPDTGSVIMSAVIARHHDDYGSGETTGPLDGNGDTDALKYTAANIEGRIQITGMWYDEQLRLTDRVQFGTYGALDFDRDGLTVPARSDTALRTTTTYGTHGRVEDIEDPKGIVMRYEYDDRGQKTKEIRNYNASVNSGNPSGTDDNVTVVYTYKTGLTKTMKADLPTGQTDQTTTYFYGTTNGGGAGESAIATDHLLQKVQYPDTGAITYAYNAQTERTYKKDQAGNVIETEYDLSGRMTDRKASTIISGFDDAVEHIETTYDNLGRRQLVTQWDALTGTITLVDEVKYTYDDWGNLEKFEQDRNSAVGASGSVDDYEVSYVWEKATTGRNTLRRTSMTLPSGNVINYNYRSTGDLHDDEASRVTDLSDGAVKVAAYNYNGVGHVVGTDYPEPDIMWFQYGTTSGSYPDLDRFNRVAQSRWTRDLATDVDFYSVNISYDRNSNVTLVQDNVHAGFDVSYTIDDLNRVTRAEEGSWNISTEQIDSRTRDQQWTLDHVGNWDVDKVDLDGDGLFSGTDEVNDDRTHNEVNELRYRDTDDNGTDDFTLDYDDVGNMTDDGEDYEYEWDTWGRLRAVNDTSSQALVVEYKYNGLGYRIAVHEDTDDDGDVDSSDLWYYDAYDERWREAARFRSTDVSPKEELLYHSAGAEGLGLSSYTDLFVFRDKDGQYTAVADGTLEGRAYYCQNWQAHTSVVVGKRGKLRHWTKYSPFGVPFGLPGADTDSDGDCDSADVSQVQSWVDSSVYNVLGDIDLDGDVDATDRTAIENGYEGDVGGRGELSPSGGLHRRGARGTPVDTVNSSLLSLRNGHYSSTLGRHLGSLSIAPTPTSQHETYRWLQHYQSQSPVQGGAGQSSASTQPGQFLQPGQYPLWTPPRSIPQPITTAHPAAPGELTFEGRCPLIDPGGPLHETCVGDECDLQGCTSWLEWSVTYADGQVSTEVCINLTCEESLGDQCGDSDLPSRQCFTYPAYNGQSLCVQCGDCEYCVVLNWFRRDNPCQTDAATCVAD